MEEIVYLDGSFLPRSEAKISPFDHGFLYGYGLFETMRAYNGHLPFLERHLARLEGSAQLLGLASGLAGFNLEGGCRETLRVNGLRDARLRLTVSGGEGEMVPDPSIRQRSTVLIVAQSYTPPPPETYEQGFRAVVASLRRNSQSPLSRVKSTNYLESLLARRQAKAAGADEAIFLNDRGFLAEASTSNIFLVVGGVLLTPPLDSGILPGITRQAVLDLAPPLGVTAKEQETKLKDLFEAEEAFLTNSLLEIMPLTGVEERPIGERKPGPVTSRLMAAYSKLVER
jgi:branched-chain amino acid aminotransferase